MFQEIAIIIIGILVVAYLMRRIYLLFFTKGKVTDGCCCGCSNCPKGQCGIPNQQDQSKAS